MKSVQALSVIFIVGCTITVVDALVPPTPPRTSVGRNAVTTEALNTKTDVETTLASRLGVLATVAAASAVLAFHPMEASAVTASNVYSSAIRVAVSSSSVTVSEAIKVLDMSLPSYDDVKSYKASVETVKSLSTAPSKEPAGSLGKSTRSSSSGSGSSATSSSTSDDASDGKGGFSVSTFLPSVGKQGPKSSPPPGYDF